MYLKYHFQGKISLHWNMKAKRSYLALVEAAATPRPHLLFLALGATHVACGLVHCGACCDVRVCECVVCEEPHDGNI